MKETIWQNLARYTRSDDAIEGYFSIGSNSAWFEGHFPDNPVLPGISMLGMIQELLRSYDPQLRIVRIKRTRFRQIVHENVLLGITITRQGENGGNYSFDIKSDASLICSGVFEALSIQGTFGQGT